GNIDWGCGEVVIVEPLARSMGHQSWFARNLTAALIEVGLRPILITFDGMHDSADIALRDQGCDVRRILSSAPVWLRWLFGKITGIAPGTKASPSAVRWPFQIYLYNQLATVISVIYAAQAIRSGKHAVCHLLCPPSWLTLCCWQLARGAHTSAVVTTFAAPRQYRGNPALLKRLCRTGAVTILVQTGALASDWMREVGLSAVRTIAMPSGDPVCRKDPQECRRQLGLPLDKAIVAVIGCMTPQKGYVEL